MLSPPPETVETPAEVVTTDADGNSVTQVFAEEPAVVQRISCPGNLVDPAQCTELRDAEGHQVGRTSIWTGQGVTVYEVVVKTDNGGLVYLATANSNDDKWGAGSTVTTDEPPLTLARMRTIVEDRTWTDWTPPVG